MKQFSYFTPATLAEATEVAKGYGFDVSYLAGGTDLIVRLKNDHIHRPAIIDLKKIDEIGKNISQKGDRVVIGALVTLSTLEENEWVKAHFPALREAVSTIGSVQIRNRATLAGNICNASPAADSLPPLFIYGAEITLIAEHATRTIPIDEFVLGPGKNGLNQGELVKSISLPIPDETQAACYDRLTRRKGVDLATISVCCQVFASGAVRFAVGAAAPVPFIVSDHSGTLTEAALGEEAKQAMIKTLMQSAAPIDDVRASKTYRQAMLTVLARRTLGRAIVSLKNKR